LDAKLHDRPALLDFALGQVVCDPFNVNQTHMKSLCLPAGREVFPAGLANATVTLIRLEDLNLLQKLSPWIKSIIIVNNRLVSHNYPCLRDALCTYPDISADLAKCQVLFVLF
jgi:hypothetical protein